MDRAIPTLKKNDSAIFNGSDGFCCGNFGSFRHPAHIVVTCDAREINFQKLRPYLPSLQDSVLIYAIESNPDNVMMFPSEKRLAVSGNNELVNEWLAPCLGIQTQLPA